MRVSPSAALSADKSVLKISVLKVDGHNGNGSNFVNSMWGCIDQIVKYPSLNLVTEITPVCGCSSKQVSA